MLKSPVIKVVIDAAHAHDIEPATLLALVEVETAGEPFEKDGRTPRFLFERHVFYRELGKVSSVKQSKAVSQGLAHKNWQRATQYKDQGTSEKRLALLEKVKAIDIEAAYRSCSWGVGQTMGFLAEELGFTDSIQMVETMIATGLAGQVDCMVREIVRKNLVTALNRKDWPHVARVYNGSGYAANKYDVKLKAAHEKWVRKLPTIVTQPAAGTAPTVIVPPEETISEFELKAVQARLKELGYEEVGEPDGKWGSRTTGAMAAFQAHEGLPVTGQYDAATRKALATAQPRPPSQARALATAADLKQDGSRIIEKTEKLSFWGRLQMFGGSIFGGGVAADQLGFLDNLQGGVDRVNQARGVWASIGEILKSLFGNPTVIVAFIALAGTGFIVWRFAKAIERYRVEDHNTGKHSGD